MAKTTFIAIALFVLLGYGAFNASAQMEPSVEFDQITLTIDGKLYQMEYAHSFEQRAQGLMFRESLCDDCGMFFKFASSRYASMWMKNTNIALDVAYIDRNGVITDIKPLEPHDLTSVQATKEVLYALEMNQGWFASHDIRVGDQIEINR